VDDDDEDTVIHTTHTEQRDMDRGISTPTARRRSISIATGIGVAAAMIVFGSGTASAASGTQIVTGATVGGVLSITAPAALALPALVAGSSTAATGLGNLSWTDTMDDSVVSSVTLAATNLWHAAGAGLYIPWADFTITVDPTTTPNVNNTGAAPVVPAGSPYVLTGAPTTDFGTYCTPITLATASATSEGTWTQAGNQITVAVPANTTPGTAFSATIQYTVTG
jgi:hypothetical protein